MSVNSLDAFAVTLADLTLFADAACELDAYKDMLHALPDEHRRVVAMVADLHAAVERAAGAAGALIYAPDDDSGFLDYDAVKRFFAEKLATDFSGRGRVESAFFHTVQMAYAQGLKNGAGRTGA